MRKTLSILLTIVMVVCVGFAFAGCGRKTDYASVADAMEAYKNGENLVGKTISVTANMDYAPVPGGVTGYGGVIFCSPLTGANANVYICPNGTTGRGTQKGETVVMRVTDVDDHLTYSIYIAGDVI